MNMVNKFVVFLYKCDFYGLRLLSTSYNKHCLKSHADALLYDYLQLAHADAVMLVVFTFNPIS